MRRLIWVVLIVTIGTGCDTPAPTGPEAGADVSTAQDTVSEVQDAASEAVSEPDVAPPERPPTGELSAIEPGGETICSRGTPFRFFVYGGDPNRVVIDFQGGGACWNDWTCSIADAIFSDSAGSLSELESYMDLGFLQGIYAFDEPDNPFYGWTLVHVPYCTGDIHWGDATVVYADDVTIHHRGYRNVKAVLSWLDTHYPNAEQVVSTGCSAGAYGAIGHAPTLAEMYPEAKVTVIADAGSGIITDNFLSESFPNWNAAANMPMHLEGIAGKDIADLTLVDFYVAVAAAYPDMRVSQHTAAHDKDQIFYWSVMGGDEEDWHPRVVQSLVDIRASADNFRYYLAPGPIHCVHPYDITYTREVGGVRYADWVRELVGGETLPEDAVCVGDCRDDPICASCADGTLDAMACVWCDGWEP